ncbi:MAG: cation:proton antiporter [Betaproteobacteria bacterium]|nr:cation:proton antiporter [Betaproteobacteria bacterium]
MSVEAGVAAVAVHKTEALLFFTLLQLAIIVLVARLGGEIALRVGQSAAVGEIIVGVLLGPSLFGMVAPGMFQYVFRSSPPEAMQMLSQIGLILLMFQIGMEFDFSHLSEPRNRRAVTLVAAAGLIAPFGLGLVFGYLTAPILSPQADALGSALFIATAFSITALPILGRIMIDFRLTRHRLGVIAISAAAINDVIGWLLLALVTTLTVSHFDAGSFAGTVALLAGFMALCWFVVRPLLKRLIRLHPTRNGHLPNNMMGILLAGVFVSSMATYKLGIFAIFGGFMLGVLLHDEHALVEAWKERVGHFVTVFFLPIFFTYTGLRTHIGGLDTAALWGWCGLVLLLATAGKFGGSYVAARLAGLGSDEGKVLGIMMNTRALMELIVINVGYDLGVISQNVFTMLVIMAIASTVVTTPGLRRWLPRLGLPLPAKQH